MVKKPASERAERSHADPLPTRTAPSGDAVRMARSFYAEIRRVRNDKIKNELGVALRYPTYKEGLRAIATMG